MNKKKMMRIGIFSIIEVILLIIIVTHWTTVSHILMYRIYIPEPKSTERIYTNSGIDYDVMEKWHYDEKGISSLLRKSGLKKANKEEIEKILYEARCFGESDAEYFDWDFVNQSNYYLVRIKRDNGVIYESFEDAFKGKYAITEDALYTDIKPGRALLLLINPNTNKVLYLEANC